MKNKKEKVKNTLIKILACILATAFTATAAVFNFPWLCSGSVVCMGIAVMLDG